jgi:taurine transport system substrate-binding protein
MKTRRRTSVITAGLAAALLALAACGSDSATSNTSAPSATAESSATADGGTTAGSDDTAGSTVASTPDTEADTASSVDAAALPDKIRIAYQQVPNGDLVVKNLGYLEDAFGPDVDIEWNLFASGGDVNQAVLAGSVDIGLVGSSPASRGLSSGIEYRVPWIFDVIGSAEALVAQSGITSIEDLKGKTVATPFASTAHFSLLAALADAGVAESDVTIIDAEPDAIYAGWSAGQIDAAYVWNPNLAKLKEEGGTVLIDSAELAAKGKTTYDLAVVTNEFAAKYPEAVNIWAAQQDRAVTLIKTDPDAAAEAIAIELNIAPEDAKAQLGDLEFLDASEQIEADYLGGGLATNLFASAEFNLEQGKIDAVQPEDVYTAGVDDSFAKSVNS